MAPGPIVRTWGARLLVSQVHERTAFGGRIRDGSPRLALHLVGHALPFAEPVIGGVGPLAEIVAPETCGVFGVDIGVVVGAEGGIAADTGAGPSDLDGIDHDGAVLFADVAVGVGGAELDHRGELAAIKIAVVNG